MNNTKTTAPLYGVMWLT